MARPGRRMRSPPWRATPREQRAEFRRQRAGIDLGAVSVSKRQAAATGKLKAPAPSQGRCQSSGASASVQPRDAARRASAGSTAPRQRYSACAVGLRGQQLLGRSASNALPAQRWHLASRPASDAGRARARPASSVAAAAANAQAPAGSRRSITAASRRLGLFAEQARVVRQHCGALRQRGRCIRPAFAQQRQTRWRRKLRSAPGRRSTGLRSRPGRARARSRASWRAARRAAGAAGIRRRSERSPRIAASPSLPERTQQAQQHGLRLVVAVVRRAPATSPCAQMPARTRHSGRRAPQLPGRLPLSRRTRTALHHAARRRAQRRGAGTARPIASASACRPWSTWMARSPRARVGGATCQAWSSTVESSAAAEARPATAGRASAQRVAGGRASRGMAAAAQAAW